MTNDADLDKRMQELGRKIDAAHEKFGFNMSCSRNMDPRRTI